MRNREIDKEYRCCLCCHVKIGTIFLGLWQVLVHLAVFGMLAALVTHPELFNREEKTRLQTSVNVVAMGQKNGIVFNDHKKGSLSIYGDASFPDSEKKVMSKKTEKSFSTPAPEEETVKVVYPDKMADSDDFVEINLHGYNHDLQPHTRKGHWKREDRYVGMALTLLSLIFSGLLLYGAARERPSYLMPYFCLQVFDFVISCLSIVGYFSYLPDVKLWLRAQRNVPYKQQLLMLDQATLTFSAMAICLLALAVKAYLLGMVWTCYKYLVRKQTGQLLAGAGSSSLGGGGLFLSGFYDAGELSLLQDVHGHTDEDGVALGMLPPKYDDVLKTPANAFAPPPYFRRQQAEALARVHQAYQTSSTAATTTNSNNHNHGEAST